MLKILRCTFSLKSLPSIAGLIVITLGAAVLAGWALGIGVLKRIAPGWIAMTPNSAISFILAGVSLLLQQTKQPNPRARWLSAICAGFVLVLAGLTLGEYAFNLNTGVDQVLFREAIRSITTAYPGRMAATTAINFALIAFALFCLNGKSRWSYRLADFLASGVELVSLAVLLTYLYDISYLNGTAAYTQMALHTALAFIVLCAGLLLTIPHSTIVSVISGDHIGSVLVRRLLPAAILVPSILSWIHVLGERAGLYDNVTGAALLGVETVVCLSLVTVWSGRRLNQIDAERLQAFADQAALATDNAQLYEKAQFNAEILQQQVGERTQELQHALDRVQTADRAKTQMLANVSHEMRTPLSSITGFSNLLLTRHLDADTQRQYLGAIHEEGWRLAALVDNLLDLQQIEAGHQVFQLVPVDLAALVRNTFQQHDDAENVQRLRFALEPTSPVLADANRIRQVLLNLVSNALKFSDGEIEIAFHQETTTVHVSVGDQGAGIPPQELAWLFELFQRGAVAERERIRGTGLGLVLCKEIIEAHQGRIWAESAGEGQGATFHFTLPLAAV